MGFATNSNRLLYDAGQADFEASLTGLENRVPLSGVKQQILDSEAASQWGIDAFGNNKGFTHFIDKPVDRIASLETRLGLPSEAFSPTLEGFNTFTEQALNVQKNGLLREINGKQMYFVDGANGAKKGVVVIIQDGKLQSMLPSTLKDFNKLK